MDDPNAISISVMIAGRAYPLKVKVEDEEPIRKVVSEINDKIKNFQMTYTSRDKQDCMAMALLTYAVDYHKALLDDRTGNINARLDEMESLLDRALN
jgi:cell division protein ZapA (FtsZ GTPase activity inhibitor)